jgi:hypothetical protein
MESFIELRCARVAANSLRPASASELERRHTAMTASSCTRSKRSRAASCCAEQRLTDSSSIGQRRVLAEATLPQFFAQVTVRGERADLVILVSDNQIRWNYPGD